MGHGDIGAIGAQEVHERGTRGAREVHERGTRGAREGHERGTRGAREVHRLTFLRPKELLISLGCSQSVLDPALFIWRNGDKLEGIIVLHVDYFLIAGTMAFYEYVVKQLTANFEAGKICKSQFDYIGLSIHQSDDGILVYQHKYIEALKDIINDKESELYHLPNPRKLRTICGQLNWVSA